MADLVEEFYEEIKNNKIIWYKKSRINPKDSFDNSKRTIARNK